MSRAPSNKGMKLTKLSAAWLPEWTCRLMPAPFRSDAGTASQLIPGVLRTRGRRCMAKAIGRVAGGAAVVLALAASASGKLAHRADDVYVRQSALIVVADAVPLACTSESQWLEFRSRKS